MLISDFSGQLTHFHAIQNDVRNVVCLDNYYNVNRFVFDYSLLAYY